MSAEAEPLAAPKPDMGFGLRTQQSSQQYLREQHSEAAVLSRSYLNALSLRHAIPPWPSPGIQELAFPCIILEAKSDSQPLLYAENQAAGGTATCLKMIERLEEVYFNTNGQRFSPLSFLAICSEGPTFAILIAFQGDISDASIAQNIVINLQGVEVDVHNSFCSFSDTAFSHNLERRHYRLLEPFLTALALKEGLVLGRRAIST